MARRGEEMPDDFGTVSVQRGERAREIELLRQHYREHREALVKLAGESPTEVLSGEYQRLIRDIDSALAKIDEIEGRRPATLELQTEPGTRTLHTTPPPAPDAGEGDGAPSSSRIIMIVVAGVIVLAIIGYLIYRASGDRGHTTTTTAITETSAPSTIAPIAPMPAPVAGLTASPVVVDFGTIRKGTRATRQVEIANDTAAPMTIKVSRSQCKCLYYEYKDTIAPKKKETITVTVDGARAKSGTLQETIDVTSKKDPSVTTSLQVTATIR
jgi:hypothetical protein